MPAKKNEALIISIPAIKEEHLRVRVVGETPLVVHRWTQKAKQQMLDKMTKRAPTKKHDIRNPVEDFMESLYWMTDMPGEYTEEAFAAAVACGARFGFPATAFKAAAVSAGYRAGLTKDKVSTYGAFHIQADLVEIDGIPEMREDMVRVSNGQPDIRYRGMFREWEAEIELSYNTNVISAEQLINLINYGGYTCGVGENRPERGGNWGRYHVQTR